VVRSQSTLQRLLRGEIKKKTPDISLKSAVSTDLQYAVGFEKLQIFKFKKILSLQNWYEQISIQNFHVPKLFFKVRYFYDKKCF
jgi:hypothetical protein